MLLKFIGIFILAWTITTGVIIYAGIKSNKTTEEMRYASKGAAIFLSLICLGLWLLTL